MNALDTGESPRVLPHTRRRPGFSVGLATGLVVGALSGGALTFSILALAPESLFDGLRGDTDRETGAIAPTASPTPTPLPTATWSGDVTELPREVTQPGAVVVLGEPATLLLEGAEGERVLVEITAETIEPAPDKDQRVLQGVAPVLTGQTVYYARMSARWLAGDPLGPLSVSDLFTLIAADGTVIPGLTLRDWSTCESPSTPPDFATATAPTAWCVAAASPTAGLVPIGLRFSQPGGPYDSPEGDAGVRWVPEQ